jgi:DNA-binding NarL/FixJ family response regulator
MRTKILIVDDSPVIRSLVRSFIESHTDWQVCGEAENGQAAVDLVRRLNPDLLVLDLSMPVMNGIDAAREIAAIAPQTKIVLFTIHGWEHLVTIAQAVGIRAVVSKDKEGALDRLLGRLREAHARA